VSTLAQAVDFLAADLSARYALVEGLIKSWALDPSGSMELSKVTEEQVAIAEIKPNLFSTSFFLVAFSFFD